MPEQITDPQGIVLEQTEKPIPVDNPSAPDIKSITRGEAIARRNALVKELFRIAPYTHPPKPYTTTPNVPKSSTDIVEKKDLESSAEDKMAKEEKLHSVNGVHLDLYDYFALSSQGLGVENIQRLQYINAWVSSKGATFADGMRSLHKVDLKLGSSDMGESKLIKLYNYLRFSERRSGNTRT